MENFLAFVLILVIAIGGFFYYTNSGTPLNESPPAVTEKKTDAPAAPATETPATPAATGPSASADSTIAATPAPATTPATTPAPALSTTPAEPAKPELMKAPTENIVALPSLDAETAKAVQEMIEKAKTMNDEEKAEMEKKATEMMTKTSGSTATGSTPSASTSTSAATDSSAATTPAPPAASTDGSASTGTTSTTTAPATGSESSAPSPAASSPSTEPAASTSAPPTSTEPAASAKPALREGTFMEIDFIHKGSGKAIVYPETADGPILRLENFEVTRGPDLYVYLSKNTDIKSRKELGDFVSLGALKSSKGNQNYKLPANFAEYKSVVIWCQAFGVLFSSATLKP